MRSLKALIALGGTVAAANSVVDCGNIYISTSYVTAPASTVTDTIFVTHHEHHSLTSFAQSIFPSAQTSSVISTVINLATSTDVVTLAQSTVRDDGLHQFSFLEQNGNTVWLGGKTPPSSLTYAVQTSNIQIQPIPITTIVPEKDRFISSKSTLSSKKAYTGHGPAGWNATTFDTVVGSSHALKPTAVALEEDKFLTNTASLTNYPTAFPSRRLKGRAVGDMVVVEVDGVAVSWVNQYNGTSPQTSSSSILEPSHSAQVLPIYPWDVPVEISAPSSTVSQDRSVTLAPYSREDRPQIRTSPSSVAVMTSVPFPNLTTTAAISAEITGCTDRSDAEFTINFDDLPHFSVSSDSSSVNIPPIFNPYRKLFWQGQFGYVPPPSDPFPPHSPPQLAVYRAHGSEAQGSPDAGLELLGEVGSGPRASDSSYWFDAHSVWFGCSDGSHVHCIVTINGYTSGSSTHTVSYKTALDPCLRLEGCALTHIEFPNDFKSLSGLQFIATIAGEVVDYYMDDLQLIWSNQTCAAAEERSSAE